MSGNITFWLGGFFPFSMGILAISMPFIFLVLEKLELVSLVTDLKYSFSSWLIILGGTSYGVAVMLNRLDVAYQIIDGLSSIL